MMRTSRHLLLAATLLWLAQSVGALPPPSTLSRMQNSPRRALPVATPTPARQTRDAPVRSNTVVVIDAGHGGFDRGGIPGQRVPESIMTLDVALRLRSILQASGYPVVMTRSSDVFVPLGTRVAIANSYRNGIFVCIHFNSATRRGANGIETYFYSGQSLSLASASITMSQVARPPPIVECVAAVITYCGGQPFPPCSWNAVFSPTLTRLSMFSRRPTGRNWPKKLRAACVRAGPWPTAA